VDNSVGMKVVESMHKLLRNLADLNLWKLSVVLEDLEELTLSEFSDHAELVGSLE
jgi:hypothetical protein